MSNFSNYSLHGSYCTTFSCKTTLTLCVFLEIVQLEPPVPTKCHHRGNSACSLYYTIIMHFSVMIIVMMIFVKVMIQLLNCHHAYNFRIMVMSRVCSSPAVLLCYSRSSWGENGSEPGPEIRNYKGWSYALLMVLSTIYIIEENRHFPNHTYKYLLILHRKHKVPM